MADTCISTDDFAQILADFQRTVSWENSTKTIDPVSGVGVVTFAAASDQQVVFFRNDERFIFDKEGITEVGDAYILATPALGFAREDKVTIDSEVYVIYDLVRRHVMDVQMFDYCVLYLVDK